jgi:hypothetical protein
MRDFCRAAAIAAGCSASGPAHDGGPSLRAVTNASGPAIRRTRRIERAFGGWRPRASARNVTLDPIAASLAHMHLNRMLRTAAREQELVIYDLLARLYRSQLAGANARARLSPAV